MSQLFSRARKKIATHQYNGEGPDGIAFGNSSKLYVMLASPGFSGVSVLSPTVAEGARFGNPPVP